MCKAGVRGCAECGRAGGRVPAASGCVCARCCACAYCRVRTRVHTRICSCTFPACCAWPGWPAFSHQFPAVHTRVLLLPLARGRTWAGVRIGPAPRALPLRARLRWAAQSWGRADPRGVAEAACLPWSSPGLGPAAWLCRWCRPAGSEGGGVRPCGGEVTGASGKRHRRCPSCQPGLWPPSSAWVRPCLGGGSGAEPAVVRGMMLVCVGSAVNRLGGPGRGPGFGVSLPVGTCVQGQRSGEG